MKRHISHPHGVLPTVARNGFSLVEIMVGLAIGLLGVLIIMQVSTVFEGQKRTTTAGADAQTSGSLAFYSVEQDVRRAGYGFSMPGVLGCTIHRYYDGAVLPNLILQPLVITKGTGDASDSIQMLSSSKANWSVPVLMYTNHAVTAQEVKVTSTLGVQVDDLLIAYEPGKDDCAMFQATGPVSGKSKAISDTNLIEHKPATSDGEGIWNPEDPKEVFKVEYTGNQAFVFNMGNLIDRTYSTDGSGNLLLKDGGGTRVVASDVMRLKAQYGIVNAAKELVWSDTLASTDIVRLYAARIAIVTRSPLKERPNAEGNCDTTKSSDLGTWASIDVSKNADGSANADWECYRYRAFENVIPLRNMMWRESDE